MNLLHIDSSALGTHSITRELGRAWVERWLGEHPGATRVHRDLAANPLPHWAPVADAADPAARHASEVLDEFLAADVVVIGAPMYNFTIASSLKAWIDRVLVAGRTFRYTAAGPEGLARGKRVVIVSARGGVYRDDDGSTAMDFQETYLRKILAFIGITDVEIVRAEGVNLSPEDRQRSVAAAHEAIQAGERIAA